MQACNAQGGDDAPDWARLASATRSATRLASLVRTACGDAADRRPARPLVATPLLAPAASAQPADPLPSWNDGPAKQAILDFVRATTEPGSPDFVPPEERLATFDQDGTLWVEHPIYSQVVFALDRVVALAP